MLESAFLNQIQERGYEREEQGRVGGEQKGYVEKDPAGMELRERGGLLAWAEGRDEAEEETHGQDEDAEGDGFIAPVNEEEGSGEDEAEQGLGLVGIDRKRMMGSIEHLGERDEVKEECRGGGWDGNVAPTWAVVKRCREDCQSGYAVEEDRDSEPEERHSIVFYHLVAANLQYIGLSASETGAWDGSRAL